MRERRPSRYGSTVIDGKPPGGGAGVRQTAERLLTRRAEIEEADLERTLRQLPDLTRANVVAVVGLDGEVGRTTCSFVAGNLFADRSRLRAIAVDATRKHGRLAALVPDKLRSERSLVGLLADLDAVNTTTDVRRYVSALPTGLHVLSAPADAKRKAALGADGNGRLVALLSIFYEVILFDLGAGVTGPPPQVAIERADQVLLVSTPERITSTAVRSALEQLQPERTTVVVNKFHGRRPEDLQRLEAKLRERGVPRPIAVPYDDQLACMLDTATYELDALNKTTRLALKRVGVAVAEHLV